MQNSRSTSTLAAVLLAAVTLSACGGGPPSPRAGVSSAPSPTPSAGEAFKAAAMAALEEASSSTPSDIVSDEEIEQARDAWTAFATAIASLGAPAELRVAQADIVALARAFVRSLDDVADSDSAGCFGLSGRKPDCVDRIEVLLDAHLEDQLRTISEAVTALP